MKFWGVIGIVMVVLLASCSTSTHSGWQDKRAHMEENHSEVELTPHAHDEVTRTMGPGLGPAMHQISLRQFDRVEDIARRADDLPPPITRTTPATVRIDLITREVVSELAPNVTYLYWTFNDTVPGPFLRIREGDTISLTLHNDITSGHNHSIDLHAVSGPGGGAGLTEVAPGEAASFSWKALNPGLYVYHCATPNAPTHVANGMYGLILVEPKEGLPKVDKELYLMQGEFYTRGNLGEPGYQAFSGTKMLDERPEYIVWNGRVRALADHAPIVNVGERVRIFAGNGGVSKISSFHVIGDIFDEVYDEGATKAKPNVQSTLIPAGGAVIADLQFDVPGRYMIVDHALARIDRGAWGVIDVRGDEDKMVFAKS